MSPSVLSLTLFVCRDTASPHNSTQDRRAAQGRKFSCYVRYGKGSSPPAVSYGETQSRDHLVDVRNDGFGMPKYIFYAGWEWLGMIT